MSRLYLAQIEALSARVSSLEAVLKKEAAQSDASSQMMTMPCLGPITAMAIEAFAPALTVFQKSRDFAAWLGLVPRQYSSGRKQALGRTSKMGQRDIRRLLITGAMSVNRWASRKGAAPGSWLHAMLLRKPRMVVAIALANKMARILCAMETRKEVYRDPQLATV
ncbi:transposase [Pseudorhodobacter sp. MZDSW-24AT]|uniref:transposase n=1 Tax=Pseudorhodobacter sp. MZDSW-24AT TaxID=2052957 RepID=UPI0018E128B5|nr:transposase [Pseudorhodobacter sp. MZDSW-24AT]